MTCVCVSECVNIVTIVIFYLCHSCPRESMFAFGFAIRVYNRGSLSHVWFMIKRSNIFDVTLKRNEANIQSISEKIVAYYFFQLYVFSILRSIKYV